MTRPRGGLTLAVHTGQLVAEISPLTPGCPVHSCHLLPAPSVVIAPLVRTHVGSVACDPAETMQAKTRSLATAGGMFCRRSTPAAGVPEAHGVTAHQPTSVAAAGLKPTMMRAAPVGAWASVGAKVTGSVAAAF